MLTAIRSRLTYGNVMATIAVFIALGGVTYAALPKKSVGTKQLKNKSVNKKKLKNKAVGSRKLGNKAVTTAKIAGSAVTSSKIASNAVKTADIANGAVTRAKVADSAIPFLGTLRSGQELRGVFTLGGDEASGAGSVAFEGISLQFPLENPPATPPQANIVDMTAPSPATTASCGGLSGGNEQTPLAAPGQICVYITDETNLTTLEFAPGSVTRLGFGLRGESSGAGEWQATGQWAVTAP